MATFEFATADGAKYAVDAPDEQTAIAAFNQQAAATVPALDAGDKLGYKPTAPRTGSRLLDTFDAAMRGAGNTLTFGMADRIAAMMDSATGRQPGGYEENLKRQYATDDFDRKNNPAAAITGDLAGAAMSIGALPTKLTALTAATRTGRALQGAVQGAALGAAQGFGQSRADTLGGMVGDAVAGGAVGGLAGGALGAVMPAMAGAGPARAPAGNINQAAVEAAQRAGIDLPAIAASDSKAVQQLGRYMEDMPFVGTPLQAARETTTQQMQQKLANIAMGMGKSDPVMAGEGVQGAITRYAKTDLPAQLSDAYGAIPAMKSGLTSPLYETQTQMANIMADRVAAGLGKSAAVDAVSGGAMRRGGLTPKSIQKLRTSLGEKIDTANLNPNISAGEAKSLYGALTKDYHAAIQNTGGKESMDALRRADALTKTGKMRVDALEGLARGNVAPEAVTQRVANMALEGGRGNIKRLLDVRRVTSDAEWGNVGSSVLHQLGHSPRTGEFSPAYLVSNWDKMSGAGKRALFGKDAAHLQSISDVVEVARRMQALEKNANKSRSGIVASVSGTTAGLMTAPISTLATVLGGRAVSSILAKPVTAQALASYSKAYQKFVANPTAITLGGVTRRAGLMSEVFARELGIPANDVGRATIGHLRAAAEEEAKRKKQER